MRRNPKSSLKGMIQRDIKSIFLNPREFGEIHKVDGKEMYILIDEKELVEREKKYKTMAEGLHTKQLLFFVSAEDYGPLPLVDRQMELDGEYYTVVDAADEGGVYSITLEERQQ